MVLVVNKEGEIEGAARRSGSKGREGVVVVNRERKREIEYWSS